MNSRREFLNRTFFFLSFGVGAGVVAAGCDSGEGAKDAEVPEQPVNPPSVNTQDSSAMTASDVQKRKQLGYVDQTPIADNYCANCALYLQPKEGSTKGGCQLFKGPVEPNGYCTYWAALQQ